MPQDTAPSSRFDWPAVLPWLLLVRAPALALRGRVMLLAGLAVAFVAGVDYALAPRPALGGGVAESSSLATPLNVVATLATNSAQHLGAAWWGIVEPFVSLTDTTRSWGTRGGDAVRGVWRLVVWGLLGGALMRIAALHLTRGEAPDVSGAFRYAWSHRYSLVVAPTLLLAGLALMAAPLGVARLAMQVSWLAAGGAVLWPLVLVASLLAAFFAIGGMVGWPLVWATMTTERSDPFDAISRTFAYVYQKPLRLVAYVAIGGVLAWGVGMAVEGVLAATLYASQLAVGSSPSPWAIQVVDFWEQALVSLAGAYFVAVLWTTAAGIYLLRRNDIDGVELDEVYLAEDESLRGFPELEMSANGVPQVVSEQAA